MGPEDAPRSVRLRIDLAYDGSGFSGWAAQPGRRTVEDVLAAALGRVLRLPGTVVPPGLTVAGRTDAGVHARGQVVHADVPAAAWTALSSTGADHGAGPLARLAAVLPADVRVHAAGPAPDGFDARFSALWRRYSYRVCDDPARADPLRQARDALVAAAAGSGRHERGGGVAGRRARLRRLLPPPGGREHRPGAARPGLAPGRSRRRGGDRGRRRVLPQHGARAGRRAARRRRGAPAGWPAEVLAAAVRDPAVRVVPPHGLCLEEVGYPEPAELAARAAETRQRRTATVSRSASGC